VGAAEWNAARSISLQALLPAIAHPHFEFWVLQRGGPRRELESFVQAAQLKDASGDCPDLLEAAADLMNLDLLITVDTMLADLAGALGRPVWVLLHFESDWRWMMERSDTPWYPSMRLFRQPSPGDWARPVEEMVRCLGRFGR
jgi:ADP-heptose:LPS heptosyltransferase